MKKIIRFIVIAMAAIAVVVGVGFQNLSAAVDEVHHHHHQGVHLGQVQEVYLDTGVHHFMFPHHHVAVVLRPHSDVIHHCIWHNTRWTDTPHHHGVSIHALGWNLPASVHITVPGHYNIIYLPSRR